MLFPKAGNTRLCPAVLYDTIQRELYCHLNCGHMEWDQNRPAGVWDHCQEGLREKCFIVTFTSWR